MAAATVAPGGRILSGSSPEASGSASSPPLGPEQLQRYQACVLQGKEEARAGRLRPSLQLLREACELWPSAKLRRRVERLQEALAELEAEEEEEEEAEDFVTVPGCGLRLYRGLYQRLYPHQRAGVAFLHRLHSAGRPGGILADDMGLGKTVQLIAFLSGMFDAGLVRCCLLLLPGTLLSTWRAEFTHWTPGLRIKEFHGTKRERTKNLERVQRHDGVAITTYQMVINNWQQLSSLDGREFTWDYIVLDEAHKIKSKSTKTSKCVSAIPAKNRILLTGTPVQNNLQEMWSLFDFACQGSLLGTSKTFKMEYENPLTRAREKDATPGEKALGLRIAENLMKLIEPYFLRRTKENVQQAAAAAHLQVNGAGEAEGRESPASAQMPELTRKNDLIVWVHLSQIQEEIYKKFVSSDQIQELLQTKRSPLVQLTNLKKLCDHPRLLPKSIWQELGLDGCDDDGDDEGSAFSDISHVPDEDLLQESGKLVFLLGLLEKLREEGNRTLVFSQSRKMLDILHRILSNRDFRVMRVDGTMALPERQKRIDTFQRRAEYSVFLLTTQVGGVGLTLTAANRVVVVDPSWNPATDAQAVDRAYRIGQTDNVVIYRLVTCGSVEEKIYRRQIFKDSLVRQSVGEKKNPFRYFSSQELRELFILEDPRTSSTQRQLQSMHASQRRTDTALDHHIAFLHTLPMFGVTDHDLIYSRDVPPDEENAVNDPESRHYIQQRVQKAEQLVAAESQVQQQLAQSIQANTEPAWLNKPRNPPTIRGRGEGTTRPEPESTDAAPAVLNGSDVPLSPDTVDLTQPIDKDMADDVPLSPDTVDLTQPIDKDLPDEVFLSPVTVDLTQPIDKDLPDEVFLSPVTVDLTQPIDKDLPDEVFLSPVTLDLTQPIDKDMDEVSNLSCKFAELPIGSEEQEDSVVLLDSFESPSDTDATRGGAGDSVTSNPGPAVCQLPDVSGEPSTLSKSSFQKFCSDGQGDHSEAELSTSEFNSPASKPDFNLVLEETMEEVEDLDSEEWAKAGLLAKDASHSLVEAEPGNAATAGPVDQALELFISPGSGVESPQVLQPRKKFRARVICSDSEEEVEGNLEPRSSPGLPMGSPVLQACRIPAASTPKGLNSPLIALLNRSGNCSVASRRSMISLVIDDVEDMDEGIAGSGCALGDDTGDGDFNVSSQSDGEGSAAEPSNETGEGLPAERSAEQGPPDTERSWMEVASGDTRTSESSSLITGSNEEAESEEDQSGTFDPELGSDEQLETFTQAVEQPAVLDTRAASDEYESLVKRGREHMGRGELRVALNCLLQALDLKSGDPELQLMAIKLYRLLDRS